LSSEKPVPGEKLRGEPTWKGMSCAPLEHVQARQSLQFEFIARRSVTILQTLCLFHLAHFPGLNHQHRFRTLPIAVIRALPIAFYSLNVKGGSQIHMLNKVMLIGYAGADSEMKFTAAGIPVANFSLAVKEVYKNSDGEKKTNTLWIRCVAWRRWAEIAGEFVTKGKFLC